ncbi:hypothetical protein [Streptococcus uberis]|uniref:hypothetical protein n=1 Tax=Streptococcus uberis TaxID=1349 RepID=UPI0012B594D4|nr:hypothetical protein [Streptococcus uberis]MCK1229534.1 hypothetical protein [Streptococcus uberis]MCV6816654.1 hypothetical protein [Streptococcus uberis]MCZ8476326.1 hypothetical protein [Streptococcus uberis]MTB57037.1 hypothetical protein [Streptococcus uberis]
MNGYIGLLIIVIVSILGVVFLKWLFTKTYRSAFSDKAGQESGFTYIIHFKDLDEIPKFWENETLKDKISIISENKKGTTYTVSSKFNDQKLKTSLMNLYDLRADQVSVTSSVMFTGAL